MSLLDSGSIYSELWTEEQWQGKDLKICWREKDRLLKEEEEQIDCRLLNCNDREDSSMRLVHRKKELST